MHIYSRKTKAKNLTQCDDLPHEYAVAPDVGLRSEHGEVQTFRGHPSTG